MEIWEYSGKRRKPGKASNAAEKYNKIKTGVPVVMEVGRLLVTFAR